MKLADEYYVQQELIKRVLEERAKNINPKVTMVVGFPEPYFSIAVKYLGFTAKESRGFTNYEFAGKSLQLKKIEKNDLQSIRKRHLRR